MRYYEFQKLSVYGEPFRAVIRGETGRVVATMYRVYHTLETAQASLRQVGVIEPDALLWERSDGIPAAVIANGYPI